VLSVLDRARLAGECITVWPTAGTAHNEGTTRNDGLVISVVSKLCDVYPVAWVMTCWLRLALMAVAVDRRIDVLKLTHFPKGLCGVRLPLVVISVSFSLVVRSNQWRVYLEHLFHRWLNFVCRMRACVCVCVCTCSVHAVTRATCFYVDTTDTPVSVLMALCPRTGAIVPSVAPE